MNILELFYKEIIKEAAIGRINGSDFPYNILFETDIPSLKIKTSSRIEDENVLVPTLTIKDIEKFNNLLLEYVETRCKFSEIPEKDALALIWSNATPEDFNNPIEFLQRQIDFLQDDLLLTCNNIISKSEVLNSDININISRSSINSETPYRMEITLSDQSSEEKYFLPDVYLGISDGKAYIYAIQKDRKKVNEGAFSKRINRLLYKVNDGIDPYDNSENFDTGNLKDVSASFVLAANITLGLLNSLGISQVIVPSILITRWNGKELANKRRKEAGLTINEEEHDILQSNLTEKLLRTFRRLEYHHSGINVESYPFESDSTMHINISNTSTSSNQILDETFNLDISKVKAK